VLGVRLPRTLSVILWLSMAAVYTRRVEWLHTPRAEDLRWGRPGRNASGATRLDSVGALADQGEEFAARFFFVAEAA